MALFGIQNSTFTAFFFEHSASTLLICRAETLVAYNAITSCDLSRNDDGSKTMFHLTYIMRPHYVSVLSPFSFFNERIVAIYT